MKFVKLSVFALTMSLFAASCGSGNAETPKTDSAATAAPAPAPTPALAPADTMTAAPAKPDSAAAAAPAADKKMDEKKK